jgi:TM2 domain-containing membrane protein YozV
MGRQVVAAFFVVTMVAIIVGVDLSFFGSRTWFWERLAVNVGVVLVFGAFYFRFVGRP